MKADNWEGHKEVFKHSVLPIIADELASSKKMLNAITISWYKY
jgi:hypothetical protein